MVAPAFRTQELGGEGKERGPQGQPKLHKEFQEASGTQNIVLKDKQGKKQNKNKSTMSSQNKGIWYFRVLTKVYPWFLSILMITCPKLTHTYNFQNYFLSRPRVIRMWCQQGIRRATRVRLSVPLTSSSPAVQRGCSPVAEGGCQSPWGYWLVSRAVLAAEKKKRFSHRHFLNLQWIKHVHLGGIENKYQI